MSNGVEADLAGEVKRGGGGRGGTNSAAAVMLAMNKIVHNSYICIIRRFTNAIAITVLV